MKNNDSNTAKSSDQVLVTGGGGFLGGAIVRQLVERGDRVISFSRRFYPELAAMGVEQIQGDISDATAVEQACREVDLVFHVAAKPGVWGDYVTYYQTNVIGTQNVIAACKQHNVLRLVYTSSPSVVFDGDEIQFKLQEAIVTLPEKQQLVFNMKYFDNLKYQQMSEILETSVGSLKASYHHARKKIESHLLNH